MRSNSCWCQDSRANRSRNSRRGYNDTEAITVWIQKDHSPKVVPCDCETHFCDESGRMGNKYWLKDPIRWRPRHLHRHISVIHHELYFGIWSKIPFSWYHGVSLYHGQVYCLKVIALRYGAQKDRSVWGRSHIACDLEWKVL